MCWAITRKLHTAVTVLIMGSSCVGICQLTHLLEALHYFSRQLSTYWGTCLRHLRTAWRHLSGLVNRLRTYLNHSRAEFSRLWTNLKHLRRSSTTLPSSRFFTLGPAWATCGHPWAPHAPRDPEETREDPVKMLYAAHVMWTDQDINVAESFAGESNYIL